MEKGVGLLESARPKFVSKVYSILAVQFGLTAILCQMAITNFKFKKFLANSPALTGVSCIISIIIPIILFCCHDLARKVPTNYVLLSIFTLSESYLLSSISLMQDPKVVGMAALLTTALVLILTVYAMTTKKDLTIINGTIASILMAVVLFGILTIFTRNEFLHTCYICLGLIAAGIYLVVDTQEIIGGKRIQISVDDYILASFILYVDIVRIFLKILELLGKDKKKEEK